MQPNNGASRLPPFGRGFLAGGLVFWPTVEGLRVLKLEDGEPAADWYGFLAAGQPLGNLAFGDGWLVAANEKELWAYLPEARRLSERRQEAAAHPEAALARYLLARAEADAGITAQAEESFSQAERPAQPGELYHDVALRGRRSGRHRFFLVEAEQARTMKHWDKAAAQLDRAAAAEFSISERLQSLARQADLWTEAARPDRAVAVWQTILGDDAAPRRLVTAIRRPAATSRNLGCPANRGVDSGSGLGCLRAVRATGRNTGRFRSRRAPGRGP